MERGSFLKRCMMVSEIKRSNLMQELLLGNNIFGGVAELQNEPWNSPRNGTKNYLNINLMSDVMQDLMWFSKRTRDFSPFSNMSVNLSGYKALWIPKQDIFSRGFCQSFRNTRDCNALGLPLQLPKRTDIGQETASFGQKWKVLMRFGLI